MIDTQPTTTIFGGEEQKPSEENPDNFGVFSEAAERLFKDYQNYVQKIQSSCQIEIEIDRASMREHLLKPPGSYEYLRVVIYQTVL